MILDENYKKITKLLSKRSEKDAELIKIEKREERKRSKDLLPDTRDPILLTKQKQIELEKQLARLLKRRTELNEAWRLAVEEGDDRETDALSVSLNLIEDNEIKIGKLEETLHYAETPTSNSKKIGIGSKVEVLIDGTKKQIHIVDSVEADPKMNKFSDVSPLGKSVIGKRNGQKGTYKLPNGKSIDVEVIEILET